MKQTFDIHAGTWRSSYTIPEHRRAVKAKLRDLLRDAPNIAKEEADDITLTVGPTAMTIRNCRQVIEYLIRKASKIPSTDTQALPARYCELTREYIPPGGRTQMFAPQQLSDMEIPEAEEREPTLFDETT